MADPHSKKTAHDDEESIRTPTWLPVLGLCLLILGALSSYLWISPGTLNAADIGDAGDGGDAASTEAATPAPAVNAAPAQGAAVLNPRIVRQPGPPAPAPTPAQPQPAH